MKRDEIIIIIILIFTIIASTLFITSPVLHESKKNIEINDPISAYEYLSGLADEISEDLKASGKRVFSIGVFVDGYYVNKSWARSKPRGLNYTPPHKGSLKGSLKVFTRLLDPGYVEGWRVGYWMYPTIRKFFYCARAVFPGGPAWEHGEPLIPLIHFRAGRNWVLLYTWGPDETLMDVYYEAFAFVDLERRFIVSAYFELPYEEFREPDPLHPVKRNCTYRVLAGDLRVYLPEDDPLVEDLLSALNPLRFYEEVFEECGDVLAREGRTLRLTLYVGKDVVFKGEGPSEVQANRSLVEELWSPSSILKTMNETGRSCRWVIEFKPRGLSLGGYLRLRPVMEELLNTLLKTLGWEEGIDLDMINRPAPWRIPLPPWCSVEAEMTLFRCIPYDVESWKRLTPTWTLPTKPPKM